MSAMHTKKIFTNCWVYDIIQSVRYLINKLEFDEEDVDKDGNKDDKK